MTKKKLGLGILVLSLLFMLFPNLSTVNAVQNGIKFSLREHKFYAAYNPDFTFTKQTNTIIRQTSSASALGDGYIFVVINRNWLNGKYIRFNWEGYDVSGFGTTIFTVTIYDGSYDRSSDIDFPSGSSKLVKGAGLLQTLRTKSASFGAETVDIQASLSSGTQTFCTVFFWLHDGSNYYNFWEQIDFFEINSASGGSGNLANEHFTDSITMEKTGSYGDYGYISSGDLSYVSYLTSYFNNGGKFLQHQISTTFISPITLVINGSSVLYGYGTVIQLIGASNGNSSYQFYDFTLNSLPVTTNFYNHTIIANITIWCNFQYINTSYYYNLGYLDGYSDGYSDGYNVGFFDGNSTGYALGYSVGYSVGYAQGYIDGGSGGGIDYTPYAIIIGIIISVLFIIIYEEK